MTSALTGAAYETIAQKVRHRLAAAHAIVPPPGATLRRRLPFLTLELTSLTPGYLELCERALVDDRGPSGHLPPLKVVVADRSEYPVLNLPTSVVPTAGLTALIEQLESEGLDGYVEADYRTWHLLQLEASQGLMLLNAPGQMAPWETSFPLRQFLHWGYAAQGMRLLHAAALGVGDAGVLLAGPGGAGKSGTSLTGILHGLNSVGDDYLAVAHDATGVRAFQVAKLMKQDADGLTRLGVDLQDPALGKINWQGKFEFDPLDLAPRSMVPELPLKAVLLPHITREGTTRLTPASPHEVMSALMPNNLGQLPGRMRQGFDFIGHLSRDLPGHHLALSTEPEEVAATLTSFLTELAA